METIFQNGLNYEDKYVKLAKLVDNVTLCGWWRRCCGYNRCGHSRGSSRWQCGRVF